jgi:hypothetical protein
MHTFSTGGSVPFTLCTNLSKIVTLFPEVLSPPEFLLPPLLLKLFSVLFDGLSLHQRNVLDVGG